jgi:hypothetical protein
MKRQQWFNSRKELSDWPAPNETARANLASLSHQVLPLSSHPLVMMLSRHCVGFMRIHAVAASRLQVADIWVAEDFRERLIDELGTESFAPICIEDTLEPLGI